MPTIFKPFSKERCARCSDFPIYNDKENYPGYYERSREYRINGYCSNYCEDMAEVEDREIDLEAQLLETQQALLEREDAFWVATREADKQLGEVNKINKELEAAQNNIQTLLELEEKALKRESVLKAYKVDAFNLAEKLHAANARIEELEREPRGFKMPTKEKRKEIWDQTKELREGAKVARYNPLKKVDEEQEDETD